MSAPTMYEQLAAMRARGERPLGGVFVTDSWKMMELAQRLDLMGLYLRKSDRWADYRLDALHGLDVLIHLADYAREAEAVAAVCRAQPRSLRVWTDGDSKVLFGGADAVRETMTWILERARQSSARVAA